MSQTNPAATWVAEHTEEVRQWPAVEGPGRRTCAVAVCSREEFAVGLCRAHYKRARRMAGAANTEVAP